MRPIAGKIGDKTSLGSTGSLKHGFADADALFFDAVEEPTRPNELRRQDTQSEQNGEPTGPWSYDHGDTQNEQGKPGDDFEVALRLLYGLYEHFNSNHRSTACLARAH